jgi:hypothetical protein
MTTPKDCPTAALHPDQQLRIATIHPTTRDGVEVVITEQSMQPDLTQECQLDSVLASPTPDTTKACAGCGRLLQCRRGTIPPFPTH